MKKFLFLLGSLAILFASLLNISCEVGLGSSVDTQPPVIDVTLPEADMVIREEFTMSGTCDDEQGVSKIQIELTDTSTKKKFGPYEASIDTLLKTWEIKLNTKNEDDSYPIPDGTYEAKATAIDFAHRKSYASKSFTIDNTAPLLVLTRPSTKIVSDDETQDYDSYGSQFDITGQAADDNNIDKLVVTIYNDKECTQQVGDPITLENVPPTIDLTVAKDGEADGKYRALYGSDINDGNKALYCSIEIYDGARHCPELENDTGNSRTAYYLYTDIYTDLLQKYKVTEIYHILNGSYESSSGRSASADEIQAVKDIIESSAYKTVVGSFTLNPDNSPVFTADGLNNGVKISGDDQNSKYLTMKNSDNGYGLLSGGTLAVAFKAGLDKSPLVKKSIGLYLMPYVQDPDTNEWYVSTEETDKIWLIKPFIKTGSGFTANDYSDDIDVSDIDSSLQETALAYYKDTAREYLKTSGSYDFTATFNVETKEFIPVKIGTAYAMAAVGIDGNGNTFGGKEDDYGFFFISSGTPPKLEVKEINDETAASNWYLKKSSDMKFEGIVTSDSSTTVTAKITLLGSDSDITFAGESLAYLTSQETPTNEEWVITIPNKYFETQKDSSGNVISSDYQVTITATCGTRSTVREYSVSYDVEAPVVDLISIVPALIQAGGRDNNVNGKFSVQYNISDKVKLSDRQFDLYLYKDYNSVSQTGTELLNFTTSSINFTYLIDTINTSTFSGLDNIPVTIVVVAYDKAGNKAVAAKEVYLNQSTNKPVVTLADNEALEGYTESYPDDGTLNVFTEGSPITATINDDDGLNNVQVNIYGIENGNPVLIDDFSKSYTCSSTTQYSLNHTFSASLGTYIAEIIATDIENAVVNEACRFYFIVDSGAPTIIVNKNPANTSGVYYGKKGGTINVSGTAKGVGGLKVYRSWTNASVNTRISEDEEYAEDGLSCSWEDSFPIASNAAESSEALENRYFVVDKRGRNSTATFSYYVDNTKPVVTITTSASLTDSSSFKFEGTVSDPASNGVSSGVSSLWYKVLASSASAPALPDSEPDEGNAEGWKLLASKTNWNFYQEFVQKGSASIPEGALEEGEYTLYVCAFDNAQNVSTLKSKTIKVDLDKPEVSLSYKLEGASSYTEFTDSSVSVTKNFSLKYTAADSYGLSGSPSVTVINDGETLVSGSAYTNTYNSSTGEGTITFVSQQDGSYEISVTASDLNGKSTTVSKSVILDTSAPVIEVTSPDSSWQNKKEIVVRGTATDANSVKAVYYTTNAFAAIGTATDGSAWTNWTKLTGTTSWTFTTPSNTVQGETTYYFAAVDTVGNISTSKTQFTLKVDVDNPVLATKTYTKTGGSAEDLTGKFYTNKDITFAGSVTDSYKLKSVSLTAVKDSSTVQLLGGDTGYVSVSGTSADWTTSSITVGEGNTLVDGEWTLTLTVTDAADKTTSESYTMVVDTAVPEVSSVAFDFGSATVSTNGYYKVSNPTLTVNASDSNIDNVYYYLKQYEEGETKITSSTIASQFTDGSDVLAPKDSSYKKSLSLSEGQTYVYLKVTDKAGNVTYYGADQEKSVLIDKTAPSVAFVTPGAGDLVSKNSDASFEVSITDELSGAEGQTAVLKIDSTQIGTYTVSSGKISGTIAKSYLSSGSGTLKVTVSDEAGNSAEKTMVLSFDNTEPTVTFVNPVKTDVNGKIEISGTAKDLESGLKKLVLYRTFVSGIDSDSNKVIVDTDDEVIKLQEFEGDDAVAWAYGDGETVTNLDVSAFDTKSIVFYAQALDKAGNEKIATKTINVDQNTDRPDIKFTNLPIEATMSSSARNWITKEEIYASVDDDDGVTSVRIYVAEPGVTSAPEEDSNLWESCYNANTGLSYTFANNGSQDGPRNIFFEVVDAEGTRFVSSSKSDSYDLKAPFISYSDVKFGNAAGKYATILYSKVDLNNPELKLKLYSTEDYSSVNTAEKLKALMSDGTADGDELKDDIKSKWKDIAALETSGGDTDTLYVITKATDANGIKSLDLTFAGVTTYVTELASVSSDKYILSLFKVDLSSLTSTSSQKLEVKTYDNANNSTSASCTFTIDNEAPSVNISTPASASQHYGSQNLTVSGYSSSDAEELYMAVTQNDETVPAENAWVKISETMSAKSWSISFNGESGATETEYKTGLLNTWVNTVYGAGYTDSVTQTDLCIWLYAKDALGNSGISSPKQLPLTIFTQGDMPTIEISQPKADSTVGGTITIMGSTTIVTSSVSEVYVQIDPDYDAADYETNGFSSAWETHLNTVINTATAAGKTISYSVVDSGYDVIENAILAEGTTSWSLSVNAASEFNNEDESNRDIAVRVYAVSASGKVSEPKIVIFTLDPGAPRFGDSQSVTVVQYANNAEGTGDITASLPYEKDMWLKGKWWLVCSVEDDSGIKSIKDANGADVLTQYCTRIEGDEKENYNLKYPIGSETANAFGSLSYKLTATEKDAGEKYSELPISINYDNKAPEFSSTTLDADEVNTIIQSDNVYEMKGKFYETGTTSANQSGFSRIAFYVTQTVNSVDYLADIMVQQGDAITDNSYALSGLTYNSTDGLYWKTVTGCEAKSGVNIVIPDDTEVPAGVRIGGLIKVNKVIYRIKKVDGKTIEIDKRIDAATGLSVDFAMAQVIDHTVQETGTTLYYGAPGNTIVNDDNDQMVEAFTETTGEWKVSINSLNIKDGNVKVHFVAFDQAGNVTKVDYDGLVSNNAPRIAGIKFGTDENGDGSVSSGELRDTYSGLYAVNGLHKKTGVTVNGQAANGNKITKIAIPNNGTDITAISGNSVMTVKGPSKFVPEIVGGNDGLGWTYTVDGVTKNTIQNLNNTHSGTTDIRDTSTTTIDMSVVDFLKATDSTDGEYVFGFNIWDYTEGTTAGTDSNKAEILLKLKVALQDGEAPSAKIKPFYWESSSVNSLYQNKAANGHIELQKDLIATDGFAYANDKAVTEGNASEYDIDPKVSGIIYLEGTASDNVIVKKLSLRFPGLSGFSSGFTAFAERQANGSWAATTDADDLSSDGVLFVSATSVTDAETEYDVVTWKIAIDTSMISNTADLDVEVHVQAQDRGSAVLNDAQTSFSYKDAKDSVLDTVQTGLVIDDEENTATFDKDVMTSYYKMDVVPYITKLYTALADSAGEEFARSATGRYVVRESENVDKNKTGVRLYGFNLVAGTDAAVIGSDAATPTAGGKDKNGSFLYLPIGTASSGEVYITVNNVKSLNNENLNPTFTEGETEADENCDGMYNSKADGTANNRLTDDVYLWVWKLGAFDTTMSGKKTNVTSPMMKFDNSGNYYISYGNGAQLFAINKNGTSTDLEICYNKYHNTNVAFDSSGNFYGVATNTDRVGTSRTNATSFTFFSRALGKMTEGYNGRNNTYGSYGNYYNGTNKRRLELSQYGGDNGTYNINRVQRPKLTVSGDGSSAGVYMAYYDSSAANVKFRYGTVTAADTMTGGISYNLTGNGTDTSSATGYHLVASADTDFKPGAYTAVGYTSTGKAVIAWYDADARQLVYSWNDTPETAVTTTTTADNPWQKNAVYLDDTYTGWYVDLAVDSSNHVHIAYYDSKSGNLKYVYIPTYNAVTKDDDGNLAGGATIVTVDSYLSVGTNITVNVRNENGVNIPYIYYYNTSSNQTMNSIKVAWQKDSTLRNGAVGDKFTGAWESMTIPTTNIPQDATVCGGVPTSGTYSSQSLANTVTLGYMTDAYYESAYIKGNIKQ